MALLMLFALVAGAGTALSPCVLPVLPALLSAGVTGGRRRPVGIALGLAATFTVTIVGLASVIDGVGLGPGVTRTLAVVVLIGFGIVVAVPSLAARLEAPLARLSRLGPRGRGDGFASGLLVGGALGFVYAPCAGPILAAVIAVGAASSRTVPVGLAFALGSALVLLALSLGGRALAGRVRVHRARTGPAARAGRRAHRHRHRHGDEPRRALPVGHRQPSARGARQPDARPRDLARRVQPAERPARPVALRGRGHRAPGRRSGAPAAPRPRAGVHGQPALVQHPRRQAAEPRGAARQGRARRLLDLYVHQLPAHAALPRGVGRALSPRRPGHRRRPLAGVPLRARCRQRGGRHPPRGDPLSGGAGQQARDLGRLGQPVLARRLPHRRARPGPRRALRRGRLRPDRDGHPGAPDRGRPSQPGRDGRPQGRAAPHGAGDARDLPRPRARRALRPAAAARHAHLRAAAQARDEPLRAVGHLGTRTTSPRRRARTPPSTRRSSARTPISS